MRRQVAAARDVQHRRFGEGATTLNGRMTPRHIRRFCKLDTSGQGVLRSAMTELGLSARAHDKILRTARTIADLDGSESIQPMHLNEAINYRMLDRHLWT